MIRLTSKAFSFLENLKENNTFWAYRSERLSYRRLFNNLRKIGLIDGEYKEYYEGRGVYSIVIRNVRKMPYKVIRKTKYYVYLEVNSSFQ